MVEAVFNRIVAIVENGTYNSTSLGAKGLRTFVESLDSIPKPCVLILPRGDSGWQKEAGSSFYVTTLSYDLYFYVQEAKAENDALGIADATNFNILATQIFLSRPQLQLLGYEHIAEVWGNITWQTTSNLANPILYPTSGVASNQGAKAYWGFVIRLTIPYRLFINMNPQG